MGVLIRPLLLSFVLFCLFQTPALAVKKSYIVYMGGHSTVLEPSFADFKARTSSHYELLGSLLGSPQKAQDAIFYSYQRYINGFAANLEEGEAAEIAKDPNVVSVFLNQGRKLHTTRSWDFMGLERNGAIPADSAWNIAKFGENTIIGNFDTGVWPESESFNDEGMGPIPSKWRGVCQSENNDGVRCNRKLIGVRYFSKGYAAFAANHNIQLNASTFTARDHDGHGTHTLSTAGGSFVPGANVLGYGNGTAKGGSPKARVAAYKVCWPPVDGGECFDADIMAAIDAAIADGVDVMSLSLGSGPQEFFGDAIALATFHAIKNGITVVTSAGNDGPGPGTVTNIAPWMFTVGASTMDRDFTSYVSLGNKMHFKGASLSATALPSDKLFPLISAADAKAANASTDDALLCQAGTLDPTKVKGKILACIRGVNPRVDKGYQAYLAGAVGLILANNVSDGNGILADAHLLPASHIGYTDGQHVLAYIRSTKNPVASLTPVMTQLDTKPAPIMASFSSVGPNLVEPAILKPDITAPGVSVMAAYSEAVSPTNIEFDKRRVPFNSISGTSMSCPHVSGIVGLIKSVHPSWSPAAIKSAIMTTAKTRDNNMQPIRDSSNLKATPIDYGAGHVQPNRAMDPGLVYDLTVDDYYNFLCARGYNETLIRLFSDQPYECPKSFRLENFNYPSITVPNLIANPVTVTRTVTNVGSANGGAYKVSVKEPAGVMVSVEPTSLDFKSIGEKKSFKATFKLKTSSKIEDFVFGQLVWSDGKHVVRSPIAVSSTGDQIKIS
ncbi:subtilisin-like protease SBT5.4 [Juglans regia]|uniref:Subtilisin-like protease SBT5.4 n=2 Tax=Juglans regia TaxID=51240 RepID=A0A2I4F2E1_JUGRE|nr:subtilisin-like protease SBT5.4 [Juglans regia]